MNGDEVIIRCEKLDERVQRVYNTVIDITKSSRDFMLYKGKTEYYIPLDSILFFETSNNSISAHTVDSVY